MLILPIVSADIIKSGYSPVEINNKITNIADYPEYNLLVVGKLGESYDEGMCGFKDYNNKINLVKEDGTIETPYYKFCSVSVYAIKKINYNQQELLEMDESEALGFFNSDKVVKVIEDVPHYETRSILDPVKVENNEYIIDLSNVKTDPANTKKVMDYLIYFYVGIPILALITILFILIRRRKKKK